MMTRRGALVFLLILLLAGACATGVVARAQTDGESGEKKTDLKAMVEDVEVMRRILEKTLTRPLAAAKKREVLGPVTGGRVSGGEAGGEAIAQDLFNSYALTYYDQQLRPESQGFYAPGSGAFFTFEVKAPVVETPAKESDSKRSTDLWDQTRAEVRGRGNTFIGAFAGGVGGAAKTKRFEIDQDAIDQAVDDLIEAIGEHGTKIRGLRPKERIVVAVCFEPIESTVYRGDPSLVLWDYAQQRKASEHRVVIQAPVDALEDYREGKRDLESLKSRVEITRY